jgi:hypothetical protein
MLTVLLEENPGEVASLNKPARIALARLASF